jgi:hypothetical protein
MLIHFPDEWPRVVSATIAMAVLAGLDLAGTFTAKEALVRRSPLIGAVGAALFLLLFWVLMSSLQYAELTPITFGWIVLLQVGVLMLDRFRYGITLSAGAWIAIGVMMAAQGYLVLASGAPSDVAGGRTEKVTVDAGERQ